MTLNLDANPIELPPVSDAMRRRQHRLWLLAEIKRIGERATVDPDLSAGEISHKTAAWLIGNLPEEPILDRAGVS